MLRVEAYPALGGLVVRMVGIPESGTPYTAGEGPNAVTRVIPVSTIESLGIDEALRDFITDVCVEYPGLVRNALR
jgi:hypothetical protein